MSNFGGYCTNIFSLHSEIQNIVLIYLYIPVYPISLVRLATFCLYIPALNYQYSLRLFRELQRKTKTLLNI